MTTLSSAEIINPPSKLLSRLRGLTQRRATWVLLDQAIVSGGNFLTIRYLGIFLLKQEFGNYNTLFETINYLNSLQAALVIYPLTIRGAQTNARKLQRLATASILFTLLLLPILGIAMSAATGVIATRQAIPMAIAALLLWQLQETMRRGLMSNLRFADAVWGDAASYLGQAGLIVLAGRAGKLDLNLTFMIMAATSAAGLLIQAAQIGLRRISLRTLRLMLGSFWKLGRWMLPNNASGLITALGYWYTVQYYHGAEASALFGATVLFFKPANPIQSSMSSLIVPAVARACKAGGPPAAARQALRYMGFGAVLLAPYFALLALAPRLCISLAYRERAAQYMEVAPLLRLYVANYTCVYFSTVVGAWLAGLGKSRFSFYAQIANIAATLLIGLPLTAKFGVIGLISGGMVSAGACLFGSIWFLRYQPKTRSDSLYPAARHPVYATLPPRPNLPKRRRRRS